MAKQSVSAAQLVKWTNTKVTGDKDFKMMIKKKTKKQLKGKIKPVLELSPNLKGSPPVL